MTAYIGNRRYPTDFILDLAAETLLANLFDDDEHKDADAQREELAEFLTTTARPLFALHCLAIDRLKKNPVPDAAARVRTAPVFDMYQYARTDVVIIEYQDADGRVIGSTGQMPNDLADVVQRLAVHKISQNRKGTPHA